MHGRVRTIHWTVKPAILGTGILPLHGGNGEGGKPLRGRIILDHNFLARCEEEALHHLGAILPHGTLIAADLTGTIDYIARNSGHFIAPDSALTLGQTLPNPLLELAHTLPGKPGSRTVREQVVRGHAGNLDGVITRSADDHFIVELTPSTNLPLGRSASAASAWVAAAIPDAPMGGVPEQRLVEFIAEQTGFQRVMYYQFADRGDGEVVAEARNSEVYGSYLGLRFPASDIPRIARVLYLKNPWRLIPNASESMVALDSNRNLPLDLTWSGLRAVSEVHRVYLANMGVTASLSFPVVVNGTLAALVAAHHPAAMGLSPGVLDRLALKVRAHALKLTEHQTSQRIRLLDGINRRFTEFRNVLRRRGNILEAWQELGPWLMEEFKTQGALVCVDDEHGFCGSVFEPNAFDAVDAWFDQSNQQQVWSSDSLSRALPHYPLSSIAGCLALRINSLGTPRIRIYLTRTECIHDVNWGGSPEKPVEYHDGRLGIAPRRSFEKWVERRVGYSQAWGSESQLLALKLRELLIQELC